MTKEKEVATPPLVPALASGAVGECFPVNHETFLELLVFSDFYVTELNHSLSDGTHKQKAVCKQ